MNRMTTDRLDAHMAEHAAEMHMGGECPCLLCEHGRAAVAAALAAFDTAPRCTSCGLTTHPSDIMPDGRCPDCGDMRGCYVDGECQWCGSGITEHVQCPAMTDGRACRDAR